ncbi:ribonuclease H-like domain-containing protein [Tanacetum coccineum]
MDPNSSLGKICLGENVVEISSDKIEGSRDWDSPEYQDTANSGGKKETKAMVFHKMDTEKNSDRFVAPCFVNGLEAYDEEINLGVEENMISNEYAIFFVKTIINPEEDDVELGVIFRRSFLCMTKAITDFGARTITIYPDNDPFLKDTEEEEKSMDDWDQLLDFNLDDIPLLGGEELPPFVCKMGKSSRNKKRAMENLNLFYQDIGTSSSTGRHLTQEEAAKEALALRISQKFALLEEVRPVLETMAYHDKYKKVLDEIWKEKVELDGMIMKEEEEAIKKVKGEALKEKDDPGAFIFPIRLEGQVNENALADTGSDINTMPYQIYEQLGREEMKKVNREITMINHTQAEAMGILTNVLCQVGVTTLIAKFLILDIPINRDAPIVVGRGFLRTISGIVNTPERLFSTFDGFCHQTFRAARSDIMRNAESDSDDEEKYEIKRNKFGAPIYGLKPTPYLNCNDPIERSLAIKIVNNPFQKINVWKKATTRGNDVEAESSRSKCSRQFETIEEVLLTQVDHDFLLWEGCNNEAKSRYNTKLVNLLPRHVYSSCVVNWDVLNGIGCDGEIDDMLRIKLREAKSNEEIFTFVAWIRAFNIKEPICVELCYEFYSTYEFDEVCADDELQSKKIIKFRLGGRAHNLALLEFACRLGLYYADELEGDGFDVYFQGDLHSDENFNAQEYWLSISREVNLGLSWSHASTTRNPILRVIHKMITYGFCQRTTRYDKIQKNDLWLLSMFDARHQNGYANVTWLIARWMKRKGAGTQRESQICCGQFIMKIARKARVLTDVPGVPRVGIPRPPRASMQDLYDRMGSMEIRKEAIERMEYRQSYH